MIKVEVAYAKADQQRIIAVEVLPNATIEDAIMASNILNQFPEINLDDVKVGVFSKLASLQSRLREGDRVEIYRPLQIDPKQARLLRLAKER